MGLPAGVGRIGKSSLDSWLSQRRRMPLPTFSTEGPLAWQSLFSLPTAEQYLTLCTAVVMRPALRPDHALLPLYGK